MKSSEFFEMNKSELHEKLKASQRAYFGLRMQKGARQLADTSALKKVRRNIAKLHTILRQKSIQMSGE
jgi:large subunit ribosomal protein L29